ncbi:MAG: extracellular solute-binding protein [Anaerolineae bacterium]|nr:extracellular solute-binding protein [Anaerolineae bacterium]MDW8100006.1 extracellular solute-binding protein [Anaerolineae bacterium]
MKRFVALMLVTILTTLLAGCPAPTPTPQVVEKIVTQVVEKEVVKEVVVTPTPVPTPAPMEISGFPTSDENEARTAQAAFEAADKGNPDPAWRGKKFTIAVYSGGQRGPISGPLYFWRKKFEELTGATYDIVEIPFAELREKIFTDFQTGAHNYDVIINCSNWYGDAILNDWIQPIDKYFDDPRMPKWDRDSIAPAVANLMKWGDTWYGTNYDHDAQVLYYRKDIIGDPKWQAEFEKEKGYPMPVAMDTWEEVLDIAKFFHGKDWNGDGDPDNGIALHLKVGGQGFFHFMAISAPYVVIPYPGDPPTKVTKYHNVYWFDPETMEPLINSPGHVRALEMVLELSKAGSPAMWGWSLGEAWADFLSGNAVMTFSWGDVGSLSQDPTQSVIQGKLGARGIPGTKRPYDREKGEFLNLDKPNFVGNQVGCSWHPVLSKYAKEPDLAYYFMAWQATPEINHWNVAYGWTGVDPGTTYDWFPPYGTAKIEDYVAGGYNAEDAQEFIGAFQDNFYNYPIFQNYMRIPGTPEMHEVWDVHLSEAITGQLSPQEALDRTYEDWVRIIEDYGKEELLKLYQESIGYKPE